MALIREKTEDGRTITEVMVKVSRGERVFGRKPSLKFIMAANEWLADRGWGKPTQPIEQDGPATIIIWKNKDQDF